MTRTGTSIWLCFFGVLIMLTGPLIGTDTKPGKSPEKSIEQKTKIHRLDTQERAPYDAFTYLNRIPAKADEGEDILDFTARVYSRLANQEGRILIKLPQGMTREAYLGYKIFLSTDAKVSNGNCVTCHAPDKFTDFKLHKLNADSSPRPTPSCAIWLSARSILPRRCRPSSPLPSHPTRRRPTATSI